MEVVVGSMKQGSGKKDAEECCRKKGQSISIKDI